MSPSLSAIHVYQQGCVERDIASVHACMRMDEPIRPNYVDVRVAQNRELMIHYGIPDLKCMLLVVNTDANQPGIQRPELFRVLRELAQLAGAEGSPVASIEH